MSKSCKKATLFTVILTVILAVALVIGVLFGVNKGATVGDSKTLTVSMDKIAYETDMFDDVKAECEKVFDGANVKYEIRGEMDGYDREIVFVFDDDADVAAMQKTLNARFDELTKEGAQWYGYEFDVMGSTETTVDFVADGYVLRAIIAGVVFAVLAFAYAWVRFKWNNGLVVMACTFFAMAGTAAIVILARIPATASSIYAIMVSAFFAATAALFNLNKLEAAKKSEDSANKSSEELVSSTVAKKSILWVSGVSAVAILLVGAISGMANLWFAITSVIGIAVAAFLGLVYAPAVCAALMPVAAAKEAAKSNAYKGAKKTSTKVKKAPVAPVEEAKVEEVEKTPCACCDKACDKADEEVETAEDVEEVEEVANEEPAAEEAEETVEAVETVETVEEVEETEEKED